MQVGSGTRQQQRHGTTTASMEERQWRGWEGWGFFSIMKLLIFVLDQACVYMYNISQGWQKIE